MASSSLKIVRHPDVSILYWYENRSAIQFDPPYQRKGGIWSAKDKAYLIDSVINGFDIPKFYLSDFGMRSSSLQTGKFVYAIIDGKQRFEAIFDFIDENISLDRHFVFRLDDTIQAGGLSYTQLKLLYPELAYRFDNAVLDVMSVSTDDVEDINELFKRLNKGRALVGAEVRNAALGPTADMIRLVSEHEFFTQSVRFGTLRMADRNAAAKILLFEYRGYPTSTKKKDLDNFVRLEDADNELIEAAGLKCRSHLDLLVQIFKTQDVLLSSAGQVPVYYWLAKLCPYEGHGFLRDFLIEFEARRSQNRAAQSEGRLEEVNPVLSRYDVLNRNTNDAGSHRARIAILLREFALWVAKESVSLSGSVDLATDEYVRSLRERGISVAAAESPVLG